MADRTNKKEGLSSWATRTILALIMTAEGCQAVTLGNGDKGTIISNSNAPVSCLDKAPGVAEPPPKNHGPIQDGAKATVVVDEETKMFGPTSNMGTYLHVLIPDNQIGDSGVINQMATEQGVTPAPPVTQTQIRDCWIPSPSFSLSGK